MRLCPSAQAKVLRFIQHIFSLQHVRYSNVNALADDMFLLAQQMGESMLSA